MKAMTAAAGLVMLATSMNAQELKLAPDTIVINAKIHTMDRAKPTAEALAVFGNRIVAVGKTDEIRPLAGSKTQIIDAQGRLVVPGFNDAHAHFMDGGFSLSNVNLRDAKSPEEMAQRLRDYAKNLPKGSWIVGGEWDHEAWPGAPVPTRQMIDAATPDNPVFVSRTDGHMALANSLALKVAGVTKEVKEIPGGEIIRDQNGELTGILKDGAMQLVEKVVPDRTFEQRHAAARAATEYCASFGVTSLSDLSAGDDVGVYQYMLDRGELKTRVYAVRSIVSWEVLGKAGVRARFGDSMVRIGGLKGFADGSLGSSTALMFEPFSDSKTNRGLLFDQMLPEGIMLKRAIEADKCGLQLIIHAIGDEANKRILDIYKEVDEKNGPRDRRSRIEHAQHLRPSEIPRFGKEKVIASVQPYHAIDDGRWCEERIGKERAKTTYPFRTLLDSGAVLALGTDWTVAPLDPMKTIYAAVTRRTVDGKHPDGWIPEQKISVQEAVYAYTMGSAFAEFTDKEKGSLVPGKLADLVMIDRDLFTINPIEIEKAKVLMTMMDGRVVYEAK